MSFYTSESFTPDTSVGFLAKRVFQTATLALEPIFAAEGISYVQWSAMVSIWYGRAATCLALARDLGHDAGATTRLIDTLEARGWLERTRSADDRRVVFIEVTEQGRAVADRCRQGVTRQWNAWLADWKAADVERLIGDLHNLRDRIEGGTPTCA